MQLVNGYSPAGENIAFIGPIGKVSDETQGIKESNLPLRLSHAKTFMTMSQSRKTKANNRLVYLQQQVC